MRPEMLLSVIIPVYNRQKQLLFAIDSVLKQSKLQNVELEIVVVDDGSCPKTTLEGRPARLIALPENSGPAAARNAGIEASSGEFIAFLDSDDAWLPEKLSNQLSLLQQIEKSSTTPYAVTCGFYYPSRLTGQLQSRMPKPASRLVEFASGAWFSAGSTILVSRDAFQQVGLFDARLRALEDLDWYTRFGNHGGRLHVVPYADVVVLRNADDSSAATRQAIELLLSKFGPGGPFELPPAAFRHLRAYLHLERSSYEFSLGNYPRAVSSAFASMALKIRPRRSVMRYWDKSAVVPEKIRHTYSRMQALQQAAE